MYFLQISNIVLFSSAFIADYSGHTYTQTVNRKAVVENLDFEYTYGHSAKNKLILFANMLSISSKFYINLRNRRAQLIDLATRLAEGMLAHSFILIKLISYMSFKGYLHCPTTHFSPLSYLSLTIQLLPFSSYPTR